MKSLQKSGWDHIQFITEFDITFLIPGKNKNEYYIANESFRAYIKSAKDSMFVNDALLRIADCYFMQKSFTLADKYYEKSIVFNLFDYSSYL